jgi:hypothetical protein
MKIHFFGCSFTEGGGLDDFDYYNYNNATNYNPNDNIRDQFEEIAEYKRNNRYSNIVGNLLNIETENHAFGCNSNEAILKKVFEVVNDSNTSKDDIFFVQTTFYSRKFYWYEPTKEFLSVNAAESSAWPFRNMEIMMPLHELHNLNLQYTHNEQYELDKLLINIELYNAYFKEKGIKIFWTPWNDLTLEPWTEVIFEINKKLIKKYPNMMMYDGGCMGRYVVDNKLQIRDDYKESNDQHKSLKGHKMVGTKIAKFLKEKI